MRSQLRSGDCIRHPVGAHLADHPRDVAAQVERRLDPAVGIAEKVQVVTPTTAAAAVCSSRRLVGHLGTRHAGLGAARIAVGDDAVVTSIPASVTPGDAEPAKPKSTSSGWAVTTRIRCASKSSSMTAP